MEEMSGTTLSTILQTGWRSARFAITNSKQNSGGYMLMNRMIKLIILFCAAISLCSCATQQSATIRYFWPAPPDDPKIEWIGAYSSASDLRSPTLLSKITGESGETYLERPLTAVGDGNGKVYVANTETVSIYVFDFIKQAVYTLGGDAFSGVMQNVNGIALDG